MSEALRLADWLDHHGEKASHADAAAELRRLHSELERKSDAIQRLWKERDELRSENRTLVRQNGEWHALNAELVEALKHAAECVQTNYLPDKCGHDWDDVIKRAEASK